MLRKWDAYVHLFRFPECFGILCKESESQFFPDKNYGNTAGMTGFAGDHGLAADTVRA